MAVQRVKLRVKMYHEIIVRKSPAMASTRLRVNISGRSSRFDDLESPTNVFIKDAVTAIKIDCASKNTDTRAARRSSSCIKNFQRRSTLSDSVLGSADLGLRINSILSILLMSQIINVKLRIWACLQKIKPRPRVCPIQPGRCQWDCRARSLLRGLRCAAPTHRSRAP